MSYKESPEASDEENIGIDAGLSIVDDELSFQDGDEGEFTSEEGEDGDTDPLLDPDLLASKKSKAQQKTFSLQARRAIEDHLEQRRLRKELDYLFDDEFAEGNEPKK